jgi:transcriptional regulator with XRE-family HTH domain
MTPIEVLIWMEIPDASIARRLQVSRMTVSRWRTKRSTPEPRHQKTAAVFIAELQAKLLTALSGFSFSAAA